MSSVVQAQLARLREKVATRANRPPLMAISGPRSYRDVAKPSSFAWQVKSRPDQLRKSPVQGESKSQMIHRRFTDLLRKSTPSSPFCLRCGSPGHIARNCRNALLCFTCNKFGHKSRDCTATTLLFPPTPPLKPPRDPKVIAERRESFKNRPKPRSTAMAHLRTPIVTLTPSAESELMEKQFQQSFILDDIAGWGPDKVERLLQNRFKRDGHRWIATVYAEYQYLIQAPTKAWLDSMASRGFLLLAGVEFPILAWEADFDEGMDLKQVWVRITGFPKFQWSWLELEKVFNPLGAHLLELAPGTGSRYDWRFIRVKMGVCDEKLLPPVHYVERLTPSGKIKVFDIHIEVENERTESVHAWLNRLNGRPYPNGTEFGMQPVVEDERMPGAEGEDLGDEDLLNENEGMEEAQMTPCRTISGAARKRDDDDGAEPSTGKKGSKGKAVEGSKPSGSGAKTGSGTKPVATSGSRSRTKPISATPASSSSVHSTNPFQPLSLPTPKGSDNEDETHLLSPGGKGKTPASPLLGHSPLNTTPEVKKQTWGRKKKQSPLTLKKKVSFAGSRRSGIASRLRSSRQSAEITLIADSAQFLPNINTPELADTAAITDKKVNGKKKAPQMDVPRKSLRVQAKADPSSTMSKAVKRVRDKEIGCCSSTGSLSKKVKQVADEWLPLDIEAIPLRVWDPSTDQSPLYLQDGSGLHADGIGLIALDGAAGTPAH